MYSLVPIVLFIVRNAASYGGDTAGTRASSSNRGNAGTRASGSSGTTGYGGGSARPRPVRPRGTGSTQDTLTIDPNRDDGTIQWYVIVLPLLGILLFILLVAFICYRYNKQPDREPAFSTHANVAYSSSSQDGRVAALTVPPNSLMWDGRYPRPPLPGESNWVAKPDGDPRLRVSQRRSVTAAQAPGRSQWGGKNSPKRRSQWGGQDSPKRRSQWGGQDSPTRRSQWGGQDSPKRRSQWDGQDSPKRRSQWGGQDSPKRRSQWGGQDSPKRRSQWGGHQHALQSTSPAGMVDLPKSPRTRGRHAEDESPKGTGRANRGNKSPRSPRSGRNHAEYRRFGGNALMGAE